MLIASPRLLDDAKRLRNRASLYASAGDRDLAQVCYETASALGEAAAGLDKIAAAEKRLRMRLVS
jgi:hypothetical protein